MSKNRRTGAAATDPGPVTNDADDHTAASEHAAIEGVTPLGLSVEHEQLLSKPDSKKGRLQRVLYAYLLEKEAAGEIPTDGRFLFYELEQLGCVSKKKESTAPMLNRHGNRVRPRRPGQDLGEALTHLREVELIPWKWIIDNSRRVTDWQFADSVDEFVAESIDRARINLWPGCRRPVIICESKAVGGVLERELSMDYLVPIVPTSGQVAGFLVTQVAPLLSDGDTRVLYIGDHDDAGNQIEANTRRVLERHAGCTFNEDTWERVLLTDAQVEDLEARGIEPILKTDDRCSDRNPHPAFEAEAFGQNAIVELVRARLDDILPEPLDDVLEREAKQREIVRRQLKRLSGERRRGGR